MVACDLGGGGSLKDVQFRDGRGHLVQTLRVPAVPVRRRLRVGFPCRLRPGSYLFFLSATDAAGNAQSTPTSNRLMVR